MALTLEQTDSIEAWTGSLSDSEQQLAARRFNVYGDLSTVALELLERRLASMSSEASSVTVAGDVTASWSASIKALEVRVQRLRNSLIGRRDDLNDAALSLVDADGGGGLQPVTSSAYVIENARP